MPTTTDLPVLTVADAEAAKEQLLEDIARGERDIDPLALLHADAAVDLARLTEVAADRRRAQETEEARLAALDDLRERVAALPGDAEIEAAAAAITAAVADLKRIADTKTREHRAIRFELGRLVPVGVVVPDDVSIGGATTRDGVRRKFNKPNGLAGSALIDVSAEGWIKQAVAAGLTG